MPKPSKRSHSIDLAVNDDLNKLFEYTRHTPYVYKQSTTPIDPYPFDMWINDDGTSKVYIDDTWMTLTQTTDGATGYVPYTGAIADLVLGDNDLSLGTGDFSITSGDITLTAGDITLTSGQFISSIATGTAPLSITSTTLSTNLNADLIDGLHASEISSEGGFFSSYIFCDDVIFAGTSPVWHELERQSDGGTVDSHAVTNTSFTEMDRYITPALVTTIIPEGTWTFTLFCKVSATSKSGQVQALVYRVDTAGAIVGSVLGTATSVAFSNIAVVGLHCSIFIAEQTSWAVTDRIGVIIQGKCSAAGTVTWYHDLASGYLSTLETPITLLHNQLEGLNDGEYQHLSSANNTEITAWLANVTLSSNGAVSIPEPLTITKAIGTAPLVITSTTWVDNLDVDAVDGAHSGDLATVAHDHDFDELGNADMDDEHISNLVGIVRVGIDAVVRDDDSNLQLGARAVTILEYDGLGDVMPSEDIEDDDFFEEDGAGDIQPLATTSSTSTSTSSSTSTSTSSSSSTSTSTSTSTTGA